MSLRLPVCLVVLASTLLAAAPAAAKPPRSVIRMTDAFLRAERAIDALAPEYRRRADEMRPVCGPRPLTEPEPRGTAVERSGALWLSAFLEAATQPALPSLRQLLADLDAIPTRDRLLRRGRAVWRANLDELLRLPFIEDACGKLGRWADAGWTREAQPPADYEAVLRWMADSRAREDARERTLIRVSRRLRSLGLSRTRAQAFEGDSLLDAAEPLSDALIGVEPER